MTPKVMFVLPSLEGGGAQRSVVNLVNHLHPARFETVLTLHEKSGPYLNEVAPHVRVVDLGAPRIRRSLVPLARALRRERPAVLVSTLVYPSAIAVLAARLARFGGAVVVRQENHLSRSRRNRGRIGDRIAAWAYRRADAVVAVSRGVAEDTRRSYGVPEARLRLIYNPVDLDRVRRAAGERLETGVGGPGPVAFDMVGIGRLVPQKGFDLLIRAAARLERDWRLTLLGEGPLRGELEALASELGVGPRVRFAGYRNNPFAWVAAADLFVLSSRWEGFGHVVVEAMACGTAVLATRCPSGPDEIVTHEVDGLLCAPDSVEALAEGIERLAADPNLRSRLAAAGAESVSRFGVEPIARQYETLFEELA